MDISIHQLDLQGHRGCRGLFPENTIAAFLKALDLGVSTLEMDVVITKDLQVVVSHEPYLSHEYCVGPDGEKIEEANEHQFKIYGMTYTQLQQCDCGMKPHPRFPNQTKMPAYKPLLKDVVVAAEAYLQANQYPLCYYNVEIKSTPENDGKYHPEYAVFTELVVKTLGEAGILNRTLIQCFDVRPLRYIHLRYPDIALSLLVENQLGLEENLKALGFIPQVYSPEYLLVDHQLSQQVHEHKMRLIPWTVNDLDDMVNLLSIGVDGLISDYPDIYKKLPSDLLNKKH